MVMETVSTGVIAGADLVRTRVDSLTDYEQQQARLDEAQQEIIRRLQNELAQRAPGGGGPGGGGA